MNHWRVDLLCDDDRLHRSKQLRIRRWLSDNVAIRQIPQAVEIAEEVLAWHASNPVGSSRVGALGRGSVFARRLEAAWDG